MGKQTVLVVDDSSGDRLVIRRAFERTRRDVKLIELIDGEELVNYIERKIPFKDSVLYPAPDLILLDINMRRLDGKQALKLLRSKEDYARVPVVMLTTSSREQDINESYELGGTDYITKPENFKDFMQAISDVCSYLDAPHHAASA
ncbi:MAG TPA: two-component system response regulator [Spongiibacteraceae bacterium]|nr:two-component system response regulator [Spongiibacteraceae bacterium]HCS26956.1 two-component system response regulator [Spongiibacteraceae bacterium]